MRSGGVAFSRNKIGRVVPYASFFAGAAIRGVRAPKPALVLTLTTPPLISVVGTLLKSLPWFEALHLGNGLISGHCGGFECLETPVRRNATDRCCGRLSRKRADGIIVLGDDMKARLVVRGIPEHKILVAENWADGCEILPAPFKEGPLVVHYSGTFGLAHEEHTITGAMRELRGCLHRSFRLLL